MAQNAHMHTIGNSITSPSIMEGSGQHSHVMPDGSKTSITRDGPGHTHLIDDKLTSGPVEASASNMDKFKKLGGVPS